MCNRSNEEVQQILLSQFGDDEVEIVYLPAALLELAYEEGDLHRAQLDMSGANHASYSGASSYSKVTLAGGGGRDFDLSSYQTSKQQANIRRKLSLSSFAHMWSK